MVPVWASPLLISPSYEVMSARSPASLEELGLNAPCRPASGRAHRRIALPPVAAPRPQTIHQPLNNPLIAKHPLASSGRFAEFETVVRSGGLSPSLQTES